MLLGNLIPESVWLCLEASIIPRRHKMMTEADNIAKSAKDIIERLRFPPRMKQTNGYSRGTCATVYIFEAKTLSESITEAR